jgi:hypothetical protein
MDMNRFLPRVEGDKAQIKEAIDRIIAKDQMSDKEILDWMLQMTFPNPGETEDSMLRSKCVQELHAHLSREAAVFNHEGLKAPRYILTIAIKAYGYIIKNASRSKP